MNKEKTQHNCENRNRFLPRSLTIIENSVMLKRPRNFLNNPGKKESVREKTSFFSTTGFLIKCIVKSDPTFL